MFIVVVTVALTFHRLKFDSLILSECLYIIMFIGICHRIIFQYLGEEISNHADIGTKL